MVPDIITNAIAKDGSHTPIETAKSGERYTGIAHHDGCLLYPVHREGKRSSFAHMPNRQDCRPSGESKEHRQMKEAWFAYLRTLPFFGEIVWNCRQCSKPHTYDLLYGAAAVVSEQRLGNGLRPDLTILGPAGEQLAFIEFRKSSLSSRMWTHARGADIPLFVVDVLDGVSEQATLHNRQRRWCDDVPEFEEESRQMARLVDVFPGTVFEPFHDSNGDLVDAFLHYNDEDPEGVLSLFTMPRPRRGHFLFAHDSTLGCDSQRQDRMPWLYGGLAAS